MATAKPSPDQIAMGMSEFLEADLAGTLAILSGMLQSIRENTPEVKAEAQFGADALRVELYKWQIRKAGNDRLKELREAGRTAVKKEAAE